MGKSQFKSNRDLDLPITEEDMSGGLT